MIGAGDEEEVRFDWRRGGAAVAGLIAALILVAMIFLVKYTNDARERALTAERHSYEVALVVRNVSSNVSKAEAALARFVLDENITGSGNVYASSWQLAGFQIDQLSNLMRTNPAQLKRVAEVRQLYNKRGEELSLAARAALEKQGDAGISYFYAAAKEEPGHPNTGTKLDDKLNEIIKAERQSLRSRIVQSQFLTEQASQRSDYLSVIGFIVGLGAIFLGVVAVQALRQNAAARRRIESEAERAEQLEQAVRERTQELWEANQALKQEAHERETAEAQLRQVQKMEAVGQLTGGIAHDFNNMLAVVVGGIDLALRRLNGPRREVMMHLNNAMEGATRAAALTRRLLSFARSEPLLPERVDSNDLIGGMSDLLDRTLGEQIRVDVDLGRGTWPSYVDPHQLENAIVNLAVNARDAMDGRGLMRIATENVTVGANQVGDIRPGDYVKISVTDTGCGMPPDVLERAFEPSSPPNPSAKARALASARSLASPMNPAARWASRARLVGEPPFRSTCHAPKLQLRSGCIRQRSARSATFTFPARGSCWSRMIRESSPQPSMRLRTSTTNPLLAAAARRRFVSSMNMTSISSSPT